MLNDLKNILVVDELQLVKVLINVELSAKCGNHQSEYFKGVPQGDCASANEFTYYLSKTLYTEVNNDHTYAKPYQLPQPQLDDHNYSKILNSQHTAT